MNKRKLEELILTVRKNHEKVDGKLISEAFYFAKKAHHGQLRLSKKPYFTHPLEVAFILARLGGTDAMVAAALLHDVLEDVGIKKSDLAERFGKEIFSMVEGVTKLNKLSAKTLEENEPNNIHSLLLATSRDVRIIIIKLADKLHNMRTLQYMRREDRERISSYVLAVYAPIAHKLGMFKLAEEIEDRAFKFLKPEKYAELAKAVEKKRKEKLKEIEAAEKMLKKKCACKKFKFIKEKKNLYSTYKKIKKGKLFDEIYDFAFLKVLTESQEECYAALGIINNCFTLLPNNIRDYIALPKQNLYMALHTTVIGPSGTPLEVHILTDKMDEMGCKGILVYWQNGSKEIESIMKTRISKLEKITQWHPSVKDSYTFLKALKMDFLNKTIFVFTPKRDRVDLPREATPLDFAYSLNAELGNHFWKAKVNGKFFPIGGKLKSGDIVEIITSKRVMLLPAWMKAAKSYEAKEIIKKALANENSGKGAISSLDLIIKARGRPWLMNEIAKTIASAGININAQASEEVGADRLLCQFNADLPELGRMMDAIGRIKKINGVKVVEIVY